MKNEQIKEAQEAKKREAEKKKKEMEEQRQAELKRKLDSELAAQKAAGGEVRRKFCLLGTLKHQIRALNLNIPCLPSSFHLVIPQHFICKAISRKYPQENLNCRYLWRNRCCGVLFPWRCRQERRQKISQPRRVRLNDFQKSEMSIVSFILGSFYSSKN